MARARVKRLMKGKKKKVSCGGFFLLPLTEPPRGGVDIFRKGSLRR